MFLFIYLLVHSDTAGQDGSWSLARLPEPNSALVQAEKDELQVVMDVHQLAKNFRYLGSLSGVAYYAAIGYADLTLQQQIKKFYQDVKALHEKFAATFVTFVSTSEEVLGELNAAFLYLIEGDQVKAMSTLQKVSHAGQRLFHAAGALQVEATTNEEKVARLLDYTRGTKREREAKKDEYEKKRQLLKTEQVKIQQQQQNAATATEQAKQRADQAGRDADKEREKRKKKESGPFGFVYEVLDDVFNIELLKKYEKREKAARNEQHSHEAEVKAQQTLYQQAERQLVELGGQLQKLQENVDLMDTAIESLHSAVGEFLSLSVIMRDATIFWKSMQILSEYLVHDLTLTETEILADSKQHTKVWESNQFQSNAVRLYAKWLALKLQSSYYLESTDGVQDQIASFISEKQPTVTEARKIVKQLKDGMVPTGRKNIKDEL